MSDTPQTATVLVVDALPLRTLGLATVLERLAESSRFRVTALTPDEAERWIDADTQCSMIIYNVGSVSLAEPRHARRIKALRSRAADAPLVILSDSDAREEVVSALRVGAQGFLYAGTNADLAQQALSFIFKGGAYFPSWGQARPHRAGKTSGAGTGVPGPSEASRAPAGADAAATNASSGLTDRQKAVLERLGLGDSNKAIARHLGIREGTVKVHVRQIMRKLGASNRTQAAVACATTGNGR